MDGLIICLLVVIIALQVFFRPRKDHSDIAGELKRLLDEMQRSFERIEKNFREDFRLNREEGRIVARDNREELTRSMNEFRDAFDRGIASFNTLQREKFANLDEQQRLLVTNTEKRLEEIRLTVDEKLQKTLNDRIGQSFRLVTEQLESVQKGLGEMQTLAQDVGGLKRVLSNVKTRGNIGEIQLSMLLEQILAPEQYEANVHTRKGSDAVVEFAVKLPGRDNVREFVYLPIDAKFPKDVYEQLLDAYDHADTQAIETAGKLLETTIKKMAKDISDKYLAPPATTDFGIMFLPFEGLMDLFGDYPVVVGCGHPFRAGGHVPELPQEQLRRLRFLDLNGKDLALDRDRTERLTYALGKELEIPVVSGSDTHQAVQYGCVTTVFEREVDTVPALYGEMTAGRYAIDLSDTAAFQVRTACLLKRSLKEIHALGGDYVAILTREATA